MCSTFMKGFIVNSLLFLPNIQSPKNNSFILIIILFKNILKKRVTLKLLTQDVNHGVRTGIHEQMIDIVKWFKF